MTLVFGDSLVRHTLTPELGARFVTIALGHVTREYPNKPEHTLAGPEDARTPAGLHPVFYGSYDWHSCVHSYWLLARLLRLFPAAPQANAIRALFDQQLVPERVAGECTYLAAPTARGFKRPYGWAWLLKLAVELSGLPDSRWSEALSPWAGRPERVNLHGSGIGRDVMWSVGDTQAQARGGVSALACWS